MENGLNRTEIIAPVNAVEEVAPLIRGGSNWLYGGCLPDDWGVRYPSTVLINQRSFVSAQFNSVTELTEAVCLVKEMGGHFALTLNAPFYMDRQIGQVVDLAGNAIEAGVDAFIIADPGLISALHEAGTCPDLHLSTMGLATNSDAVDMYVSLGVTRIILPRFLSVRCIADLVCSCPGMEFEAFVLVGRCPNIEGVCSFLHDSPDGRWPCEWAYSVTDGDNGSPPPGVEAALEGVRENDRRDSCGLCAIPALLEAGVRTFKIVGRGAPLERKLRLIGVLAAVLSEVSDEPDGSWFARCRESYRSLFGHRCSPHNCYYPDEAGI